jgi:hypothetical protein
MRLAAEFGPITARKRGHRRGTSVALSWEAMLARVHIFGLLLCCGASLLTASPTLASTSRTLADSAPQPGAAAVSPTRENPLAERERLRKDLSGVQAEIDRLKAAGPGLRNDYVLRARLADAEAIARRLTELDAQIKARTDAAVGHAPAALAPTIGSEPVASPTDGPTELEAKADILTDQAHRTQAQAVALQARIDQVRGRLELHRRASALENDPFAPLEGSRRRLAPGVSPSSEKSAQFSPSNAAQPPGPAAPRTGSNTPTSVTVTDHAAAGGATTPPTPAGTASAVQVRDVLDPSASAQVRRNDAAAPVPTDLPSMERQLAALKARAQHLDTQAQALRARARAH